jgi:hyperosmotically inducible periplasmic protein
MRYLRSKLILPAACAILFCAGNLAAQSGTSPSAPDNSKQNQTQSPTADNQTNAQADRTTTAKVRKAIVADKDLSTYAHNIKIITVNGAVTLKGPVKSEEEKQKIASDVASVIPSDKLTNDLTVKP